MTAFVVMMGLAVKRKQLDAPVWMCGSNSPVLDGAAIDSEPNQAPGRRFVRSTS
jgi:hypothetical protein